MGRVVKRVPLDFGWPQGKVWPGYLLPDWLRQDTCEECGGSGYSQRANELHDLWYGKTAFRPEDNGSTPFGPDHPAIRDQAEINARYVSGLHRGDESASEGEAQRLADLFNSRWMHHLNADDVAALRAANCLRRVADDATVRGVNEWSLSGLSHDSVSAYVCVGARCEREGVTHMCEACDGYGSVEQWGGQRATEDTWKGFDPPTGDGWQMWEDTSEGSPASPVFPTADGLADWLTNTGASYFGGKTATRDQWMAVIDGGSAMVTVAPGVVIM